MTIQLQIGHTYRSRDGAAEFTIDRVTDAISYLGPIAWSGTSAWWANTGRNFGDVDGPYDLVEDVTPTATGPVRQITVTRTEIVPGVYNRLSVRPYGGENGRKVIAAFVDVADDDYTPGYWAAMNAEELDAAAATLTQLANALRAIATEKGTA